MYRFDDLITTGQAAKIVGLEPNNFRHYVNRGETPEPIIIGRYMFFDRDEIKNWLKPDKSWGGPRLHKKRKKSKK